MKKINVILLVVGVFVSFAANAHSGRTNKEGCHNDHKRGTYHCH